MLTRLALRNFKSFVDETVTVAPFTLLIGANASGKSNFLDAIRFLKGLGLFPLDDILGGRYEGGTQTWPGIRGAGAEIANDPLQDIGIASSWNVEGEEYGHDIAFRVEQEPYVAEERLTTGPDKNYVLDTHAPWLGFTAGPIGPVGRRRIGVAYRPADGRTTGQAPGAQLPADRSIMSFMLRRFELNDADPAVLIAIERVRAAMAGCQFLDLQPNRMRDFRPKQSRSLGLDGANISPLLAQFCANPDTKQTVVDWISELCAPEITGFDFIETPQLNETMFQLVEANGRRISARSVSDGTLRFLGQLVALLTAQPGSILLIEELENGLHPSRQHLLVEAIQGQVEARGIQVIATTHSPTLLDAVDTATLEQAVLFARNPEGQGTVMRNLGQLPHFAEVLERRQMSELFTTQWPERAL